MSEARAKVEELVPKRSVLANLASKLNIEKSRLHRNGSLRSTKQTSQSLKSSNSEGRKRFRIITGVVTSLQQRYKSKNLKVQETEPQQETQQKQVFSVHARPALTTSTFFVDLGNAAVVRDPILYDEYAEDVFKYLKQMEPLYEIPKQFPRFQIEITVRTRAILVDWINRIHSRLSFNQETLYLTVALVDRFLQRYTVHSYHLGVLGLAATFVACKYEESSTPELKDFASLLDPPYNCKQSILQFERMVLQAVKFNLGYPSSLQFFRRFSQASGCDIVTRTMGKFFLELSLQSYELCSSPASLTSAGALFLSLRLFREGFTWTNVLTRSSGFAECDLSLVLKPLAQLVLDAETDDQRAVVKKYSCKECFHVASSLYQSPEKMAALLRISREGF